MSHSNPWLEDDARAEHEKREMWSSDRPRRCVVTINLISLIMSLANREGPGSVMNRLIPAAQAKFRVHISVHAA